MKSFRKMLALAICICVMASALPTYAATIAAGSSIPICQDLGYVGQGTGYDEAYFSDKATRLEALSAILAMRDELTKAKAFQGKENFADAAQLTSQTDRNMLAYAHANPQVGFVGHPSGSFGVRETVITPQLYKVFLLSLGYIQGVDFQWDDVGTFAESKGLGELSGKLALTNGDLCNGLVEALRATVRGGTLTLADKLVADNVLPQDKAVKAGLVPAPEPISWYVPVAVPDAPEPVFLDVSYHAPHLSILINCSIPPTIDCGFYFEYSVGGIPNNPTTSSQYISRDNIIPIQDTSPGSVITIKAFTCAPGYGNSKIATFNIGGYKIESTDSSIVTLDDKLYLKKNTGATTVEELLNAITASNGATAEVYTSNTCATKAASGDIIQSSYVVKVTSGTDTSSNTIYPIELATAQAPTADPASGNCVENQKITLTSPSGGEIRFTKDGKQPTAGSSLYDVKKGVVANGAFTLRAIAVVPGMKNSVEMSAEYTITE